MDYQRIYSEFIAERKRREADLTGYSERHHILPKCLGGGDEPQNLIRLTPEDHFFAHLLLAKVHGGKCWTALAAMANLTNKHGDLHRGAVKRRVKFAHIRRALASYYRQVLSGPDSPIADQTFYTLKSQSGEIVVGRRLELVEMTGIRRQEIARLVTGQRMMAKGWFSPDFNPNGKDKGQVLSDKKHNPELVTLHHHDGREWTGTRRDFRARFGAGLTFQGSGGHCQGWYLTKLAALDHDTKVTEKARRTAAARGCIGGAANPNADPAIYDFWNRLSGERRRGTRFDLCSSEGILYGDLGMVLSRQRQSAKGWTLWERRNEKFRRPMVSRKGQQGLSAT